MQTPRSAPIDPHAPLPALTTGLEHCHREPPAGTRGAQRLPVAALRRWEAMKFGMFVCYGLNTYVGAEMPNGDDPSTCYAPDRLDVDQWVSVARDAGMKYAILTTKHISGHCLWPSQHTDYHVGKSGNPTDVVAEFVRACARRGVQPGFYYSSWDNHHRFGSLSANIAPQPLEIGGLPANLSSAYVTPAYLDFQWAQITELMDRYGPIAEWWIDIPHLLPRDYRNRLYDHIAARQPKALILANHGIGDGSSVRMDRAWPTDLMTIERFLPNSATGHQKWRQLDGADYYLPGEVCDPIGNDWFYTDHDRPRSDAELLGMYLTSTSRAANLLLSVGPDRHGQIPRKSVAALTRLRRNLDRLGM